MNINGERFLIFGDSLTHHGADTDPAIWDVDQGANRASSAPGDILASMLRDAGATVRTDAKVGRSAHNYWQIEGNSIASDVQFKPTRVIIMLGTNDLGLNMSVDAADMTRIRDAFAVLPGVSIWAIGPPTFANATLLRQTDAVYTMLQNVFGTDHVLDTRPLTTTANRAGDGVHFTATGARALATQLHQAIASQPDAVAAVMKTGTKVALAALGLASLAGLGWLSWRLLHGRALLGGAQTVNADPKLVRRIAQSISYDVSKAAIRDKLVDEGYSDEEVFVAYQAAKTYLRRQDQPLDFEPFSDDGVTEESVNLLYEDKKRGGLGRRHHRVFGTSDATAKPPLEEIYTVGEDAIQLGDLDRARKIADEGVMLYLEDFDPEEFWQLKDKKFKDQYTYAKATKSILDDLRADGWKVEGWLKIPHATSPHGRVRLWFKPQTVHMTTARGPIDRHTFNNARAISYTLDTRWLPGPRFRMWLLQSRFPKTAALLGRRR